MEKEMAQKRKNTKSIVEDKFLITGFARSGTQYVAQCLRWLGWGIATETVLPHSHGTVSWVHMPVAKDFGRVAMQLRNPLKVIASAQTIEKERWENIVVKHLGAPKDDYSPLDMAIYAYPRWYALGEMYAGLTYRVEDLPLVYKDVMGYLGLTIPKQWTRLVPHNQNTRKGKYRELTWKDIKKRDPKNYKLIREIAKRHNYI